MCRNPRALASGLAAGWLAGALLASPAFAAPAAVPAASQPPAPGLVAAPKKADAATRAAADRLDPVSKATFWAGEVQIDPADAVAGVKFAAALRALNRFDEAAGAAERVLVLHPDDVDALLEDARAKIAAGQAFYGVKPLEHAQQVAPGDWRPAMLLGVAYAEVKRQADSDAAYRRALQLSPDNPAVLSNMAMTLAANGDASGAEMLLRRAAARPDASVRERQNLALVLGYQGKLGEAEQLIRRDLPPDVADANLAYLKAITDAR